MSANLTFSNANKMQTFSFGEAASMVAVSRELNVSNSNAAHILTALGFDPNFNNAEPIQVWEFDAAINRFFKSDIAEVIDGEKPSVRQGNIIDCGRREGYLTDRIEVCRIMTEEAINKGATHVCFL